MLILLLVLQDAEVFLLLVGLDLAKLLILSADKLGLALRGVDSGLTIKLLIFLLHFMLLNLAL